MITDAKFDTVMVMLLPSTTDAAQVRASLSSTGAMTELPDTQCGGKTAKTEDLASGNATMHVRCVAVSGAVLLDGSADLGLLRRDHRWGRRPDERMDVM